MSTCRLSLYTNHSTIRVALCRRTCTHYTIKGWWCLLLEYVSAYPIKWLSGVALKRCNLLAFVATYKLVKLPFTLESIVTSSLQSWNIPQVPFLLSTDSTDESYTICVTSICTKCLQDELTQQHGVYCIFILTSLVVLWRGSMWYKASTSARSPKLPLKIK